jgi:cytochrome bd-type quinol oxidase subunit 1
MQFPYFQFPLFGDGLIIAIDAILHVFISHGIAIGMITMIVLAEYIGYRRNSADWEDFAYTATKPLIIIITGIGAVTGVGIWFITSGLVPAGIGSMLRVFFWPWFIEWIVFVLEVITILILYFTWQHWQGQRKKYHLRLGFAYIVLALMSAFLITGILGFMLTPDGWPTSRGFWGAFFNPTFLPQLAWRICIAYSMGALFIIFYLLFSYHRSRQFRKEALSFYAKVLFVPLVLMPVCGWWWFFSVPKGLSTHAKPSLLMWTFAKNAELFWTAHIIAGAIVIGAFFVVWRRWVTLSRIIIVPAILVVLFFVAEYERVREFVRGPYLMPGYMYANTVLLTERELFKKEGMLPNSYWFEKMAPQPTLEQKGAYLFAANCGTCHTIGGKNNIVDRFKGRSEPGIYVILGRTEEMVPWMPPFAGTDEERKITAHFIKNLVEGKYLLTEPARYPPAEGTDQ